MSWVFVTFQKSAAKWLIMFPHSKGKHWQVWKKKKTLKQRKWKCKYWARGWRGGVRDRGHFHWPQMSAGPVLAVSSGYARCSHTHVTISHQHTLFRNQKKQFFLFFYHSSPLCQKSLIHSCFHRWKLMVPPDWMWSPFPVLCVARARSLFFFYWG